MQRFMKSPTMRSDNRSYNQLRQLKVTYDVFAYAAGSALFEMGNTKVLCAVTLQNGIPHFLKGKKSGWLTAEYALLPVSTPIRTVREITANKRSGRTIEISRLIGRALRAVTNLSLLGEHTIFIDCDVLQADGGTRTACITGAYLALKAAQERWRALNMLSDNILTDELAAVSVGLGQHGPLLDMDFTEDSTIEVDFNFVVTRSNKIVEIQGSAERAPLNWQDYDHMRLLALQGTQELFSFFDDNAYIFLKEHIAADLGRSVMLGHHEF
jgi:ribonuclease PH